MLIPLSIEQTLQQLRQLTQQDIQPQWWLSTETCLQAVSSTLSLTGERLATLGTLWVSCPPEIEGRKALSVGFFPCHRSSSHREWRSPLQLGDK